MIYPLLVRGIGVLSSIIGTYLVRGAKDGKSDNALSSINRGFYSSAAISLVAFLFLAVFYMHEFRAFLSVGVGIVLAIALDELTKYFTDTHHKTGEGYRPPAYPDGTCHGHPSRSRGRVRGHLLAGHRDRAHHPCGGHHLLGPGRHLRPVRRRP